MVDMLNSVMNLMAPPATMVVMAFSWPLLSFINICERFYNSHVVTQDMEDKVVVITGASSAIGEAANGGPLEEFAKMIVDGACRGDAYVKFPSWYDVFLLYRVFTPNVLRWTFKLLLSTEGARRSSLVGVGASISVVEPSPMKLMLEGGSTRKLPASQTQFPASPPRFPASPPRVPASPPRFAQFNIQEM